MIIDYTYFVNRLNLPQTGNTEGRADVQAYIDDYEPEYLRCVLGLELYDAFIAGIDGSGLPDDRWLNLLQGADFTKGGCKYRWNGFAPLLNDGAYVFNGNGGLQEFTAGGAGEFDPVAGSDVMILPPDLVGIHLNVYIRGTGWLKAAEYSVAGDQLTLLGGILFNLNTVVFIGPGTGFVFSGANLKKVSPIANYVFYQYVDERVIDFTLVGNVKSTTDNNRIADETPRLVYAWNRMVDMNRLLYHYLKANKAAYPEWKDLCGCGCCSSNQWSSCGCFITLPDRCRDLFKYKNSLGL